MQDGSSPDRKKYPNIRRLCRPALLCLLGIAVHSGSRGQTTPVTLMPQGALVYLEAKDLRSLAEGWLNSPEKKIWVQSRNFQRFENSRIMLKLMNRAEQFSRSAGFALTANHLLPFAGKRSALGLYNPSEQEFLFITELPAAERQALQLFKLKAHFERREKNGGAYFQNDQGGRVVCWAEIGPFLVVATHEELMKSCLALAQKPPGGTSLDRTQEWQESAGTGDYADLLIFLKLNSLTRNTNFRREWLFDNLKELEEYNSSQIDIQFSAAGVKEKRLFIRQSQQKLKPSPFPIDLLERYAPNGQSYLSGCSDPDYQDLALRIEAALWNPLPEKHRALSRPRTGHSRYSRLEEAYQRRRYEIHIDELEPALMAKSSDEPISGGNAGLVRLLVDSGTQSVLETASAQYLEGSPFIHFQHAFILNRPPSFTSIKEPLQAIIQNEFSQLYSISEDRGTWERKVLALIPYEVFRVKGNALSVSLAQIGNALVLATSEEYLRRVILNYQANLPARFSQILKKPLTSFVLFDFKEAGNRFVSWQKALDYPQLRQEEEYATPQFFSQDLAGLLESLVRLSGVSIQTQCEAQFLSEEIRYDVQPLP